MKNAYFSLGVSRIFSWVIVTSVFYRYLFTLILAACVATFFYLDIGDITGQFVQRWTDESIAFAEQRCYACVQAREYRMQQKRVMWAQELLQEHASDQVPSDNLMSLFGNVPPGVTVRSCAVTHTVDRDWYMRQGFRLSMAGNYAAFLPLINRLSDTFKTIRCSEFTLNAAASDQESDVSCLFEVALPKLTKLLS